MKEIIDTLQRLRQIRRQGVDQLTSRLASQKQLCQRYETNIKTLNLLTQKISLNPQLTSPEALRNKVSYKKNIRRVIDWQTQEQAMAAIKAKSLQRELVAEACKEKTLSLVVEEKQDFWRQEQDTRQQKELDGIATQCWLRQRQSK